MYRIVLLISGARVSEVGGPVRTIPEVLSQLDAFKGVFGAEDIPGVCGISRMVNSQKVQLIALDRWNQFIMEEEVCQ